MSGKVIIVARSNLHIRSGQKAWKKKFWLNLGSASGPVSGARSKYDWCVSGYSRFLNTHKLYLYEGGAVMILTGIRVGERMALIFISGP